MADEQSERSKQVKEVAQNAKRNDAWSSSPVGSPDSIPKAFVSKVQSNMSKQGKAAAGSYKRGGRVRRTGLAKVHKGERVLTAKQAKRYRKSSGKKR